MSTTEPGDSTNYPASITIPSDGDGPTIKAADVNAGFEGLADRTAWLKAHTGTGGLFLVNMATKVATASLDIAQPSPLTTSAVMFGAGITTVVGDIVEIDLAGTGNFGYAGSATVDNRLMVEIWTSQNGGAFVRQAYCRLGSCTTAFASNNTSTDGAISAKGILTVTVAGTLSVEVRVLFSDTPNTGDSATLLHYRASLRQYRSL